MKFSKNLLLFTLMLFSCVLMYGQWTPNGFNYQAVIRNGAGELVTTGNIKLRFTLYQGGNSIFQETHTVPAGDYGQVSVVVGTGTAVTGTYSSVAFLSATTSMQVEVDPTGGSNYTDLGISELRGVPMSNISKYAETSGSANTANTANTATTANAVNGAVNATSYSHISGGARFTINPGTRQGQANGSFTTLDMDGNGTILLWDNCVVDGNLGVGVNSPTKKLEVNGEIKSYGYTCYTPVNNTFSNKFNIWWSGSQALFYIDNTYIGNLANTSDRRLKENINPIANVGLDKVMALKPVTYQYKNLEGTIFSGSPTLIEGFIAQDLKAVIPSAVEGEEDAVTIDGTVQPLTVNVMPVVAVLTKAIQEQQTEIEALEAQINALLSENAGYKSEIDAIKSHLGLSLNAGVE